MKTAEEFYREIAGSAALQEELKNAADGTLDAFLKKHDCEATAKEFADYAKSRAEGELTDDAAEAAAGGYYLYFARL